MHGSSSYTQILALDLGKFNSIVCCFHPADSSHRFVALQTTPTAIHDLLSSHLRMALIARALQRMRRTTRKSD